MLYTEIISKIQENIGRIMEENERPQVLFIFKVHHISDFEGLSQLRSFLRDTIINYVPRIGGKLTKKMYRQCPPRRLTDTDVKELDK